MPANDICLQSRLGQQALQAIVVRGAKLTSPRGCIVEALVFLFDHQVNMIEKKWQAICDEAALSELSQALFWRCQFLNPSTFLARRTVRRLQAQHKDAEQNHGSDLLNLMVAEGQLTKLVGNEAVKSLIFRHESEILE